MTEDPSGFGVTPPADMSAGARGWTSDRCHVRRYRRQLGSAFRIAASRKCNPAQLCRRRYAAPASAMPDEAQLETLTADEIGLSANARIPLRFTPGHTWSPLVISFPHVGLAWPHDLRPKPQVDFARNADYEVQ